MLQPGDQRVTTEKNAHKHVTPETPWGDVTPENIQEAMSLWKEKNLGPPPNPEVHSKGSKDSGRVSVFDRIEKGLKLPTEDARNLLKKKQLRKKIQKKEEAKAKLIIEKRIQDEEKKLQ